MALSTGSLFQLFPNPASLSPSCPRPAGPPDVPTPACLGTHPRRNCSHPAHVPSRHRTSKSRVSNAAAVHLPAAKTPLEQSCCLILSRDSTELERLRPGGAGSHGRTPVMGAAELPGRSLPLPGAALGVPHQQGFHGYRTAADSSLSSAIVQLHPFGGCCI